MPPMVFKENMIKDIFLPNVITATNLSLRGREENAMKLRSNWKAREFCFPKVVDYQNICNSSLLLAVN